MDLWVMSEIGVNLQYDVKQQTLLDKIKSFFQSIWDSILYYKGLLLQKLKKMNLSLNNNQAFAFTELQSIENQIHHF
jgi:hypothetical protein